MKNVTFQRGLICMYESEFNRVMLDALALENANAQLKKELEEATKRVALLEDTLRLTEAELKSSRTTAE